MSKRTKNDPPGPSPGEPYRFPDHWTRQEILDALRESEDSRKKLHADRQRWQQIAEEAMWRLARVEGLMTEVWHIVGKEPRTAAPRES